MKQRVVSWLGVALSVALLYWIGTRFDLGAAARAIEGASAGNCDGAAPPF